MTTLITRDVPVNNDVLRPAAVQYQLPIMQWVFLAPKGIEGDNFNRKIHQVLLTVESRAYTEPELSGLYPLSLSAQMQVLKGRVNSNEIIPYFCDLNNTQQSIHTLYFHTRFSTNTDPHPSMAQPFRLMAHNGELNTDKKNRLSEAAIARAKKTILFAPKVSLIVVGWIKLCRLE